MTYKSLVCALIFITQSLLSLRSYLIVFITIKLWGKQNYLEKPVLFLSPISSSISQNQGIKQVYIFILYSFKPKLRNLYPLPHPSLTTEVNNH